MEKRKIRRPFGLKLLTLWTLGLGLLGIWRSGVLWRERHLLYELGSSLTPFWLTLFVVLWSALGIALIVAAAGLWFKKDWARRVIRVAIPAYLALSQAYTWGFVRSGLMWERRWVALGVSALGIVAAILLTTWHKTRRQIGF